ncbi:MAG TPA: hypothetical protein VMH39_00825 [Gemmatimonadaceae bacterium]|nr:hypothetical protein [Gemmatimonadaceae bacterium]
MSFYHLTLVPVRGATGGAHRCRLILAVGFMLSLLHSPVDGQSGEGRGAQALPAALSDGEFWNLVTTFSEQTGVFAAENFSSNELDYAPIAAALENGRHGGAYLGVGPEQNFAYIAAVRPQIAFIVDIRRQAMIQHLLLKALFELSADRADFISNLFAKPRPTGLDASSSAKQLWDAYWYAPSDSALYRKTRAAIEHALIGTHGFALDSADRATLEHVYAAFFTIGPIISYGGDRQDGNSIGATPAGATPAGGYGAVGGKRLSPAMIVSGDGRSLPVQVVEGCVGRIVPGTACTLNRTLRAQFPQAALPLVSLYGGANFATVTMSTDSADVARSFLGSEALFQYVKTFEARNLLVPVVGNFVGPSALRAVGAYLAGHGTTVNAFYISNVEQYVWGLHGDPPDQHQLFYANVAALPLDSSSVFIRPTGVSIPGSAHDAMLARGGGRGARGRAAGTPPAAPPPSTIFGAAPARAGGSPRAVAARFDSATERVTIPIPAGMPMPPNGLRSPARVGASLCPILPFLAALASGQVLNETLAERCMM